MEYNEVNEKSIKFSVETSHEASALAEGNFKWADVQERRGDKRK